jgi:hypothetical protein
MNKNDVSRAILKEITSHSRFDTIANRSQAIKNHENIP